MADMPPRPRLLSWPAAARNNSCSLQRCCLWLHRRTKGCQHRQPAALLCLRSRPSRAANPAAAAPRAAPQGPSRLCFRRLRGRRPGDTLTQAPTWLRASTAATPQNYASRWARHAACAAAAGVARGRDREGWLRLTRPSGLPHARRPPEADAARGPHTKPSARCRCRLCRRGCCRHCLRRVRSLAAPVLQPAVARDRHRAPCALRVTSVRAPHTFRAGDAGSGRALRAGGRTG
eukprot:366535-Chlamydomonas_euryale.AAC.7